MFQRLLPSRVDNTFNGPKLALWFFVLLVLMHLAMTLNCLFNGYFVATSADGISLNTLPPAGAQAILSLFATWGLEHLVICLLAVLVLVRYRSLVPFMFVVLLLEDQGRKLILYLLPMSGTGASPGYVVDLAFLGFTCVGLALSLRNVRSASPHPL